MKVQAASRAPRPGGRGSDRWLTAALVAALVQAIPNLCYPIGRDQATYGVIARGMLHGQALYRDLWDNKPPGIFYIYTIFVKIFGPAMWSIGVVDILWLLALSFCIFRFAARPLGKPAAFLAVVINAAMHIRAGIWDAAQPEIFVMLFVFAGYLLLRDTAPGETWKETAAGVLFAAAFWVKYNAAIFLPLLLLPYLNLEAPKGRPHRWALSGRASTRAAARFAAGFAALSAGLLLHLWLSGSWSAFRKEHFEVLRRYSSIALNGAPHYWAYAAGRIEFWLGSWTLGAAPAALALAWTRRHLVRLAPALIGAVLGFAALAAQIRYQPYYFETCYPFFAILWAYLGTQLWEGTHSLARHFLERRWRVARILIWTAFTGLVALCLPGPVVTTIVNYQAFNAWRRSPALFYSHYFWPGAAEHPRDVLSVVDFLKRQAAPAAGVYVWGNEPLVYYLSGEPPPTRFVWNLPLIAPWRLDGWRPQFMRELSASAPRFIVVAREDEVHDLSYTFQDSRQALRGFPELDAYLRSFYRPCRNYGTLEVYCRDSTVHRLRPARPK